jgi:hypothetical protein
MQQNLLKDINCRNFNIPSGERRDPEQVQHDCRHYEDLIAAGGRHRLPTVGHWPHRTHRFQRTGQPA